MITKIVGSPRRVLTVPAVQPCDSVSPNTLLDSLIHLAGSLLAYRSKHFATNSRNARRIFHQIYNFRIFLDDLRLESHSSEMPASVVLSFTEIHVVFQKLCCIFEDCTRAGAGLWMLMKSDQVAAHFQALMFSIATSLDAFSFGFLDSPDELIELAHLMKLQARKVCFRVDHEDLRIMKLMNMILSRFEHGFAPDPSHFFLILNHIGIREWSQCNDEIRFLDGELAIEEEESESKFLSSLLGFMSYCRCVIFPSVDVTTGDKSNKEYHVGIPGFPEGLNTDDLRCPISLEIMIDPVTISTGQTFDRSSILTWFGSGNATCPITGKRLISTDFVPNVAIKALIAQYCSQKGIVLCSGYNRKKKSEISSALSVVCPSSAAAGMMRKVSEFIVNQLVSGESYREINRAVFEARLLTKTSVFYRSCLLDSGAVPPLLNLLSSTHSSIQENAIATLLNLSKLAKGRLQIMENMVGGLDLVVGVLKGGLRMESKQHAAATLFYLASTNENREVIGENLDAIPGLIDLLRGDDASDRGKRNALIAIMGLLMHSDNNHWRILASGAVPLLLALVKSTEKDELISDSMAILACLAGKPDGTIAIVRRRGISLVVEMLGSTASRATKEHCVSLLLALCLNGGSEVVGALVKKPSLMGSLYSVVSDGRCGGSKRASALIRILHSYSEKHSGGGA